MKMLLVFEGGTFQLLLKVNEHREIDFCYPPLTDTKFYPLEIALKKMLKKDRNLYTTYITKFKKYKREMNDKEFEDYLIYEFTHGKWAGFALKNKVIK